MPMIRINDHELFCVDPFIGKVREILTPVCGEEAVRGVIGRLVNALLVEIDDVTRHPGETSIEEIRASFYPSGTAVTHVKTRRTGKLSCNSHKSLWRMRLRWDDGAREVLVRRTNLIFTEPAA